MDFLLLGSMQINLCSLLTSLRYWDEMLLIAFRGNSYFLEV